MTGLDAFGGYCMSNGCGDCDGACVGTATGERCMAACTRDDECRVDEGYICDPAWHACVMPNATAIVPRACPAPRGIGRDPQFAPAVIAEPPAVAVDACGDCSTMVVAAGAHRVSIDRGLGGYGSAQRTIAYRASGRPVTVSRRDESLPLHLSTPAIAVDVRRKWIYIAYVRGARDGVWDLVLAASKDGVTWSYARIGDDPPCALHAVPTLAVDGRGTLHVAWYDTRGGHGRFAHATCGAGLVKCTQRGRINDVPFAAFSTVPGVNDAATLVVDGNVLRASWTQAIDEDGSMISRSFRAEAKLR